MDYESQNYNLDLTISNKQRRPDSSHVEKRYCEHSTIIFYRMTRLGSELFLQTL